MGKGSRGVPKSLAEAWVWAAEVGAGPLLGQKAAVRVYFLSGDGSLQWRVFLSVFMLERRSARSSAYTCLCKNAKWNIIFFAFPFLLRKEL